MSKDSRKAEPPVNMESAATLIELTTKALELIPDLEEIAGDRQQWLAHLKDSETMKPLATVIGVGGAALLGANLPLVTSLFGLLSFALAIKKKQADKASATEREQIWQAALADLKTLAEHSQTEKELASWLESIERGDADIKVLDFIAPSQHSAFIPLYKAIKFGQQGLSDQIESLEKALADQDPAAAQRELAQLLQIALADQLAAFHLELTNTLAAIQQQLDSIAADAESAAEQSKRAVELGEAHQSDAAQDRQRDEAFQQKTDVSLGEIKEALKTERAPKHTPKPIHLPRTTLGDDFVGREIELEAIHEQLTQHGHSESTVLTGKVDTLFGAGGIGKTQLAIEYALRYQQHYTALLLIVAGRTEAEFETGAETPAAPQKPEEVLERLQANLAELAAGHALGLEGYTPGNVPHNHSLVHRWLRAHPGWLLILDNVDTQEDRAAVRQEFANLTTGNRLITSRLSDWGPHAHPLPVGVLPAGKGAELLARLIRQPHAADESTPQALHELESELENLPLALTQAAAYIKDQAISPVEYLRRWREQSEPTLFTHADPDNRYRAPIGKTYALSLAAAGPEAHQLLRILSFLAPEPLPAHLITVAANAVEAQRDPAGFEAKLAAIIAPIENLHQHRFTLAEHTGYVDIDQATDQIDLAETVRKLGLQTLPAIENPRRAFGRLIDFGLLEATANRSVVRLHRVIAAVTRATMEATVRCKHLATALRWLSQAMPFQADDARSWEIITPLAVHISAALSQNVAQAGETGEPLKPSATGYLLNQLSSYHWAQGSHREALRLAEQYLNLAITHYGSEHSEVAVAHNNMALHLEETARFAEAEDHYRQALAIDEATLPVNHPTLAIRNSNLAALLTKMGKHEVAVERLQQAVTIGKAAWGERHPNQATILNNLAYMQEQRGKLPEAERLYREALGISKATLPPDSPDLATHYHNLGLLLMRIDRAQEAYPLLQDAWRISKAKLPPTHPDVEASSLALAICQHLLGLE
ncbi:tetratricopeptide repeat protein [Cerasicoccus frondis]|uniref:tetratricopeptide repeat protein n=1 Tax=Cerasicoccus frondis TaxID=490090 RepID=UPI0028529F7C|nr:tetratricopeptide repeat protein [Cerasicoccus frondis]